LVWNSTDFSKVGTSFINQTNCFIWKETTVDVSITQLCSHHENVIHHTIDWCTPGYVGFEEAGQLTEVVRRKPYSQSGALFDAMEKANPNPFIVLLQLLADGRFTDAKGNVVDFKKIVLFTSNTGSKAIFRYGWI
jgi:hypothetical protein